MRIFSNIVFLIFIFLSQFTYASDIQFWFGKNSTRHSSGLNACKSWASTAVFISETATVGRCEYPNNGGFIAQVNKSSQLCPHGDNGSFQCNLSCDPPKTMVSGQCVAPVVPGGDVCGKVNFMGGEVDKITNAAGQCVHPLDADLPSTCNYLSKSTRTGSTYVSFDGSGNPINPGPIQTGGCVATPISVDHCKAPAVKAQGGVSLGPAPALCKVGLSFSGAVADNNPIPFVPPADVGNKDGVCYPGQDCKPSDLPINTDSTPCKYEWDQSIGMQVCRSTKFTGKPGDYTGCGTGPDGVYKCYGTAPSSNGIDISTKVDQKSNADGTTTTTKTDTVTQVKCVAVGSCVTTVTTNKSTTIKTGDGQVVSDSSQCTGPACPKDGKGGKGDKDGDGLSDCAVSTCDGEDEAPPEITAMTKPAESGNFDDANTEWDEKIETARQDIADKAELLGKLFQPIASLNLASGDQELGCGQSFATVGGQTATICFGKYESQLSMLAAAVLFICSLIALFIIFKPD